jgi:hypothetical protein
MTEPTLRPLFEQVISARKWQVDVPSFVRLGGLFWLLAAGWVIGDGLSLGIGAGLFVFGLLFRPLTTVAIGHAALIAIVPDLFSVSSLVSLGLFEGGLLTLLVSERPTNPVVALLTASGAVALAATGGVVVVEFGLVAGSALVVVALATISALLYRYERLSVQQILDDHQDTAAESQPNADWGTTADEQPRERMTGPQEPTQ